ncbi:TetR/AcrR family transcriptional regulator C-terminal domain-containing protein [Sphingopyxis yananensis]|uniref:TetR/AcrR family transcriptional regulator C-terminal domain-containing protein n=1 Tax=Sphingopyxis yananensis TaxID=2886687 RepID=UPI001D113E5B|nr:TetR/AcrR family transcriptional regulator C-terminal domain-containing protein [Sphingopyxis yananensis]MCC2603143.1 TetR/AcrR family transcriptional regulator C-terminal domain-containing protein [Sphingopyxis yananensis]
MTIDQVLEAGMALGLENLTMGGVAAKLGVRITVLYGYVANKDELVRLVAMRASRDVVFPKDQQQDWQTYAVQHGQSLFSLLTGSGQLISQYFSGGLGPELEMDRMEAWLEFMTGRGFCAEEALRLYRQLGGVVVGGAVTHLHLAALSKGGTSFAQAAARTLAKRGANQVPHLASVYDDFARHAPVWESSFLALLKQVSAERGEAKDTDYWNDLSAAF